MAVVLPVGTVDAGAFENNVHDREKPSVSIVPETLAFLGP